MYDIAVIGCGVVGLTSALAIQEELGTSASVVIYTQQLSPYTTGDVSAGLWTPYLLQDTPEEDIIKWSAETHNYIEKLWKAGYAKDAGITLQVLIGISDELSEIPKWINIPFGCEILSEAQLNKINEEYKKKYAVGYKIVSFIWEPTKFLKFLQQKFIKNGGKIEIKKISSFEELCDYDVVVNCTGLYARKLAQDDSVHPIRGQVCRVEAPWQFHVILDKSDDGNYVIPNAECVILGGTHQENNYNLEVSELDKQAILRGCYKFVPSLKNAKIVNHKVGLRPGRNKVRVELETKKVNGKNLKIVHNYGHGGSGVTLCCGCAADASKLVKSALNFTNKL